jgi:hypothetical protein
MFCKGCKTRRSRGATQRHALTVVEHLASDLVNLTLIKDADHRLSREEDRAKLGAAIEAMG